MPCIIVYTTTNKLEIAELITYKLLEERLAACIQIDEVTSYFKWDGKINKTGEWRLSIKSTDNCYEGISTLIREEHNYEVPEIIKINITDGSSAYLKWLASSVQ